jgi:hypothetical protein
MSDMKKNTSEEAALGRLLAQATRPTLPPGFAERMRDKLDHQPTAQVIAFPRKAAVGGPRANPWLIGAPLAASLLIGISLGALGMGNLTGTTEISEADEIVIGSGLEEAEDAAQTDT